MPSFNYTRWFIEQKRKIAQNFLVEGPGYTKRPLGHRDITFIKKI